MIIYKDNEQIITEIKSYCLKLISRKENFQSVSA